MIYTFDGEIAKKYGVEGAVMLSNLIFWIEKNKANDKHFYEGRYWTYNSTEAFTKLFPFWSRRQIQRILKNLKEQGAIEEGNFNKAGYDRTKWYTVTISSNPVNSTIAPNRAMECTKPCNGMHQTVQPIPDIKPYIKTIYNNIFEEWNKAGIVKHKNLTKIMQNSIDKAIKKYKITEKDIIIAIKRYSMMHNSSFPYAKYKWTLNEFLTREKGIMYFLDDGDKWLQYLEWEKEHKQEENSQNKSTNTTEGFDFSFWTKEE